MIKLLSRLLCVFAVWKSLFLPFILLFLTRAPTHLMMALNNLIIAYASQEEVTLKVTYIKKRSKAWFLASFMMTELHHYSRDPPNCAPSAHHHQRTTHAFFLPHSVEYACCVHRSCNHQKHSQEHCHCCYRHCYYRWYHRAYPHERKEWYCCNPYQMSDRANVPH